MQKQNETELETHLQVFSLWSSWWNRVRRLLWSVCTNDYDMSESLDVWGWGDLAGYTSTTKINVSLSTERSFTSTSEWTSPTPSVTWVPICAPYTAWHGFWVTSSWDAWLDDMIHCSCCVPKRGYTFMRIVRAANFLRKHAWSNHAPQWIG